MSWFYYAKKVKIITQYFSLLLTVLLAQCGGYPLPSEQDLSSPVTTIRLQRAIDKDAGVICYKFVGFTGIDCLLIEQTKLKIAEE